MNFVKIRGNIYNTNDIQVITTETCSLTKDYLIIIKLRGDHNNFTEYFSTEEERDEYFLKIESMLSATK